MGWHNPTAQANAQLAVAKAIVEIQRPEIVEETVEPPVEDLIAAVKICTGQLPDKVRSSERSEELPRRVSAPARQLTLADLVALKP